MIVLIFNTTLFLVDNGAAAANTAAPSFEPRGRTMQPAAREENKARDSSDEREVDLNQLQTRAQGMTHYTVQDGEFTSFPEIMATTASQLISRGYKNLFPIQRECFYPVYNREDVIARDLTGSGKTLAFCLPVTEYLRKQNLLGRG